MKTVYAVLTFCLLLISAVIIYLVVSGSALRSAGVIKPTEYKEDNKLLAKSVALRLFPEFQSSQNTIWIPSKNMESAASTIISAVQEHYRSLNVPDVPQIESVNLNADLQDFKKSDSLKWWIFPAGGEILLNQLLEQKIFINEPTVIYISEFKREEQVPENCNNEKKLTHECLKLVAVREVRKKFKSNEPYFFMRRYNDHQFFLFVETKI